MILFVDKNTPRDVHSIKLDSFILAYNYYSMQYILIPSFETYLIYLRAKAECVNPLRPIILTFFIRLDLSDNKAF